MRHRSTRSISGALFAGILYLATPVMPPALAQSAPADSAPAQATRPRFELEGNELKVPGPIVFEVGSDKIKPESTPTLEHVKAYLDDKSYITLMRIENHTDNAGDEQKNLELSIKRARAVAKWLTEKGVDCKRLLPTGFGSSKPIAPNDTPENRAKNRRTSFVNAALRGRPIGGMPVDGSGMATDACK